MENNKNSNQTTNDIPQKTDSELPNEETLTTPKEEKIKEIGSEILPNSSKEKDYSEENKNESITNNEKQTKDGEKTELDKSTKENTNSDNESKESSNDNKEANNTNKKYLFKLIDYILEKNVFSKLFVIIFATLVFSYAYSHQETITRDALSYIGLILCVIVCYIEILGIRDHIWVIEGSIPATKQWREAFFTPSTLRKHKIRKMIILLFAFLVFVGIYRLKCFVNYREAISFLGIILMVTVVYYEILAVRDEIDLVSKSLKQKVIKDESNIEKKETNESK